jgi:hypothetical protein
MDREPMFELLAAAYRRGAHWALETAASSDLIAEAANVYAGMITAEMKE